MPGPEQWVKDLALLQLWLRLKLWLGFDTWRKNFIMLQMQTEKKKKVHQDRENSNNIIAGMSGQVANFKEGLL